MQTHELAENDYMSGMKYKDIAKKYGVSLATVKSWKTRYDWNRKGMHTKTEKSMHTKKQNIECYEEPVADEVESVLQNTELTEKQRLFCLYFIKCFNATKAYRKAYQCDEYTAMANGSRLLRNAKVKTQIDKLKQEKLNQTYLTEADIFQKYMDIAFADMGDYVQFGRRKIPQWAEQEGQNIPIVDPNTGQQKVVEYNYVDLNDSASVDTSVIAEVSEGKDGVKVKLADRMKALQWISDHMNLATPEQKARIELMQAQRDKLEEKEQMEEQERVVIVNDIKEFEEKDN